MPPPNLSDLRQRIRVDRTRPGREVVLSIGWRVVYEGPDLIIVRAIRRQIRIHIRPYVTHCTYRGPGDRAAYDRWRSALPDVVAQAGDEWLVARPRQGDAG